MRPYPELAARAETVQLAGRAERQDRVGQLRPRDWAAWAEPAAPLAP
jgi:hypothetical protein